MPPERYCAPATEPSAPRIRLMRSWPRATLSCVWLTSSRSRSAFSPALLNCSVAFSASWKSRSTVAREESGPSPGSATAAGAAPSAAAAVAAAADRTVTLAL